MSQIENVLHYLPEGAFVVDDGGRVVLWNEKLEEFFAPSGRVLGAALESILPLITDPMRTEDFAELILNRAVKSGRPAELEGYPIKCADGIARKFDVRIAPLFSGGEEPSGAVVLLADVTQNRIKAEQELRRARISSLASLGASIAHEVRNPLNSIALNLQLVKEGVQDLECAGKDELLAELGAVLEEIENLDRLVGNLLNFARNPAPSLSLGDASEAVARALKSLAAEARKNSVRVLRKIVSLEGVMLDEEMLSRAIYNLALNAIQAMPSGGTLRVSTEPRRHSALIEIADTGPGVPPEEREKIFGLFYSRRNGGIGLGLPIAHRIVEGHGGHLTVENAPEGGALFQIHLPWARGGIDG